jgi:antitoxin VapB
LALNIKATEADKLARELAALTGESITEAVTRALKERIERHKRLHDRPRRLARRLALDEILKEAQKLPVLDRRSDDEILGYNEYGAFD